MYRVHLANLRKVLTERHDEAMALFGSMANVDVLNAIWKQHHRDYLPMFVKYHVIGDSELLKPYDTLPKNFGSNVLETIRNSGNAVIGYCEVLYGRGRYRLD